MNIDEATSQFSAVIEDLNQTVKEQSQNGLSNQQKAARIIFSSVYELFESAHKAETSIVKATLLRSIYEAYADTATILNDDNSEAVATAYVGAANASIDEIRKQLNRKDRSPSHRPLKDGGKWNGKSLTQRIIDADSGSNIIHIYDFLCYYAHVNPLSQQFTSKMGHEDWLKTNLLFATLIVVSRLVVTSLDVPEYMDRLEPLLDTTDSLIKNMSKF